MAHSFKEYVSNLCYNGLYDASKEYVEENWEKFNFSFAKLHHPSAPELYDATIERVYVSDMPGSEVKFDVGISLALTFTDSDSRNDEYEERTPWIKISCKGDLTKGLSDWTIINICPSYDKANISQNSLSDSLVPEISYESLDDVATGFLKQYFPEALKITGVGMPPVAVDSILLAERLNLTICKQRIDKEQAIFGQIYFSDCEVPLYNTDLQKYINTNVRAHTIIVDPDVGLLRSSGAMNNTIIHECVHWVKHSNPRKC